MSSFSAALPPIQPSYIGISTQQNPNSVFTPVSNSPSSSSSSASSSSSSSTVYQSGSVTIKKGFQIDNEQQKMAMQHAQERMKAQYMASYITATPTNFGGDISAAALIFEKVGGPIDLDYVKSLTDGMNTRTYSTQPATPPRSSSPQDPFTTPKKKERSNFGLEALLAAQTANYIATDTPTG